MTLMLCAGVFPPQHAPRGVLAADHAQHVVRMSSSFESYVMRGRLDYKGVRAVAMSAEDTSNMTVRSAGYVDALAQQVHGPIFVQSTHLIRFQLETDKEKSARKAAAHAMFDKWQLELALPALEACLDAGVFGSGDITVIPTEQCRRHHHQAEVRHLPVQSSSRPRHQRRKATARALC